MKPWCRKHGDVTACPCRPVEKRFVPALQRNWWQPDIIREVEWQGPRPVLKDRPA